MDHHKKIGGPHWGNNVCPKCGKKERRYYSGSWDWEPGMCIDCIAYEIEQDVDKNDFIQGRDPGDEQPDDTDSTS